MTKKQLKDKLDTFIKEHSPDDFKDETTASRIFFNSLRLRSQSSVTKICELRYQDVISAWWWNSYTPMSEDEVLSILDYNLVTGGYISYYQMEGKKPYSHTGFLLPGNAAEKLADWSFKYNIVKIEQKPGSLRVFFKDSEDYQSNITGEVIAKIAKCLEF